MLSTAPNPPVSVRVTAIEREMLEAAAAQAHTNLSDFVRRRALEAAENELIEHRIVTIPAADWEKFEAGARQPAKPVPALRDLAATRPAWQD
jgi:uncharacterized protein (DUF1778 family)